MRPFAEDTFAPFLIQAKRHTYAAQGDAASVAPLLPETRQLEYRDELFLYRALWRDGLYHYTSHARGSLGDFKGHEVITRDQQKVYELHYGGGLLR